MQNNWKVPRIQRFDVDKVLQEGLNTVSRPKPMCMTNPRAPCVSDGDDMNAAKIMYISRSQFGKDKADNNIRYRCRWCNNTVCPEDSPTDKPLEGVTGRGGLGNLRTQQ